MALTGWGQEGDRRRTKEAGFDAHMVKPVDFAALTKLLGESGATNKALHLVGAPALLRSADAISQREG